MNRLPHREAVKGWIPFSEQEINDYVSAGIWKNLTFGDILDRNVANIPDRVAVIDDTRSVTWREMGLKSDRLALQFKKLGLEHGDFVIVITPNVVEFYYLLFGLARIGVIPVMCLPRHRKQEVSHLTALHEAKAIVVPSGEKFDYAGMVEEFRAGTPTLKHFFTVGGTPVPVPPGGRSSTVPVPGWGTIENLVETPIERDYPADYLRQFKPGPNDVVVEQLSGGTTGLPKGIPRTHNDYIYIWDYVGRREGNTDDSVCLCIPPVAHNMPISDIAGPMFFRGGATVITRSTRPEDHFKIIEKHRVTNVDMVPVLITYWIESEEVMKKYDLSSLKLIACGAQKAKPELVRWCLEKMRVNFCNVFGMTEGPVLSTRWDSPREAQLNTVGRPILTHPLSLVKLVDNNNDEVPQGEIGELVVKGPMMTFKGYFRNPEENARCFDAEGFFHTGDLMSRRPDGRYVVEGRKKDMIIRGGENVYPEPVEGWLMKHPAVVNAAVVGMPDSRLGEKLCAFVQTGEGSRFTFEGMQKLMKDQGIAVYQWPERLEVVSGWPLTPMNKIDKRMLRAYIAHKLFRERTIDRELGDEFLSKDKLNIADIESGRVKIDFA